MISVSVTRKACIALARKDISIHDVFFRWKGGLRRCGQVGKQYERHSERAGHRHEVPGRKLKFSEQELKKDAVGNQDTEIKWRATVWWASLMIHGNNRVVGKAWDEHNEWMRRWNSYDTMQWTGYSRCLKVTPNITHASVETENAMMLRFPISP